MTSKALSKREIERVLREHGGLSARQAKRLLSSGWGAVVGDEAAVLDELETLRAQLDEVLHKSGKVVS